MIKKSNISWLCVGANFKCKNYVHFSKKGCQKVYQDSQASIWSELNGEVGVLFFPQSVILRCLVYLIRVLLIQV